MINHNPPGWEFKFQHKVYNKLYYLNGKRQNYEINSILTEKNHENLQQDSSYLGRNSKGESLDSTSEFAQ